MANKKRLPWGAIVWSGVGGVLLWRTFYRPSRAVIADGYALRCAGKTGDQCFEAMRLGSFQGAAPVYTPVAGRVLSSGVITHAYVRGGAPETSIRIAAQHEPVVLTYSGSIQPQVSEGEQVGVGQQIALAQEVDFGVKELRHTSGGVEEVPLEPASWLAARGLQLSVKAHKADAEGPNWCEGGRQLRVPESAALCGLELPPPGGLMLLPVSVTMERGA